MPTPNANIEQALEAVLARATTDREFRRAVLTDPHGAINRAFGVHVPPEVRLRFIERDADTDALIVLPDFTDDQQLSDDELENVSGGRVNAHQMWRGQLKPVGGKRTLL